MTKRVLQLNFDLEFTRSECFCDLERATWLHSSHAQNTRSPAIQRRETAMRRQSSTGRLEIDQGAKYGSEHRMSLADAPGRKNSRRKYANETRRYGHLRGADLESIALDIDPRLLDAFRYAFSDARRREVVGDDAACSATSSSRWRRGG